MFLALFLAACENPANQPVAPTYSVSGTITTSDGSSAEGAAVQLKAGTSNAGSPVLAGADGTYAITGVPAGTYTMEVYLSGYAAGVISAFTVSGADVSGKDLTLS